MTMEQLTGKALAILRRMAHFYDPAEAGRLLVLFADIFGRRLERAETDLYRVLRSHHIETADNEGSQGFIAPPEQRGDLDKLFALFLEAVGGTSQLVKTNPRFTVRSFDLAALLQALEAATPLTAYLRQRFAAATWKAIRRYEPAYVEALGAEIQAGLALELILRRSPLSAAIAAQLERKAPAAHARLQSFGGGPALSQELARALAAGLNQAVMNDPGFAPRHAAVILAAPLPPAAVTLLHDLYPAAVRAVYAAEPAPAERARLLALVDSAEPRRAAGAPLADDAKRLNRLILEAALGWEAQRRPWGLAPRRIPAAAELRALLADELNRLLDDPELFQAERFPELAEEADLRRQRCAGDLARLNRLALESAWPYAIEPSHAPYRERLQGLMSVLRRGAATRQGILDIVAANLGIIGADPAVRAARALIDIEEYLPQRAVFFDGTVKLSGRIEVQAGNLGDQAPQIAITLLAGGLPGLANLRLTDLDTGASVLFPGRLAPGDRLTIAGGRALRNGLAPAEQLIGELPPLQSGRTRWRFLADVALADGQILPAAAFDTADAPWDQAVFVPDEPAVRLEVSSLTLTYGVFTVTIPWHIAGFTDKFEESGDHPRQQILPLVNRVKAAGVLAMVAYKQDFAEDHDQRDSLALVARGALLAESHGLADQSPRIASRQQAAEDHAIEDRLVFSGQLDYTAFDSLNPFA